MGGQGLQRIVLRAAALPLVSTHQIDNVWMAVMNEVVDEAAQPAFQGLRYNYMDRQHDSTFPNEVVDIE